MRRFRQVWLVDFEFCAPPGERQLPICMVAREFHSGRIMRFFGTDLTDLRAPPYDVGPDTLFVAYYASAELHCHLALGWPLPVNTLDLFTVFRNLFNGVQPVAGFGLLGALAQFGLSTVGAAEKEEMRQLAMRGGPYTPNEQVALLDYCQTDVDALHLLLPVLCDGLDLPRSLLRGRYMKAVARMEFEGIPIDLAALATLREHWAKIQDRLIQLVDQDYGVYEGRVFKLERFEAWLRQRNVPWPTTESGRLDLRDDAFHEMEKSSPEVAPLRALRHALSDMRLEQLQVGLDGRNRCMLSAFRSRTSRNQPGNSSFIFGPAVWLRGLIRPEPGMGIAYVDWSQQEIGIAAKLSGDLAMQRAYLSGDIYLAFGKQAGVIPPNGTKETHRNERALFKQCMLAVNYGMGEMALAQRISHPVEKARQLLQLHRETYPAFWKWTQGAVDHAMLHGHLWTVFGWSIQVGPIANPRSLANFPVQANGAEMMRLAACLATERGVTVHAPVHDAFLMGAPLNHLDAEVARMQAAMAEASSVVLDGFVLRTDAKVIRYPDRFMDEERGRYMWDKVWSLIGQCP